MPNYLDKVNNRIANTKDILTIINNSITIILKSIYSFATENN